MGSCLSSSVSPSPSTRPITLTISPSDSPPAEKLIPSTNISHHESNTITSDGSILKLNLPQTPHQNSLPFSSKSDSSLHPLPSPHISVRTNESDFLQEFAVRLSVVHLQRAMGNLLSDPKGAQCFHDYLTSTYSDHHLDFYLKVKQLNNSMETSKQASSPSVSSSSLYDRARELYDTFLKPGSEQEINLPDSIKKDWLSEMKKESQCLNGNFNSTDSNNLQIGIFSKFLNAQQAVFDLMSFSCLKGFIRSEQFKIFKNSFKSNTQSRASSKENSKVIANGDQWENDFRPLQELELSVNPTVSRPNFASSNEFESCWLDQLKGISESLPVCICITDMQLADRPICYVNKEFTLVTGYPKEECIGRNCKFLQGNSLDEGQMKSVNLMREAFKLHQPIKVEIKNFRKNGEIFINLLTMKPIKDMKGRLKYYIGVQFDISNSHKNATIIQDLVYTNPIIQLLPDFIE